MSSPLAGPAGELAGHHAAQDVPGPALPDGPRRPRAVQAWLWLKKPTWFLDRCRRAYGDVFTMRLPLGINLVHVADPELVKAVFGGNHDVLRAGERGRHVPIIALSARGSPRVRGSDLRARSPPWHSWS